MIARQVTDHMLMKRQQMAEQEVESRKIYDLCDWLCSYWLAGDLLIFLEKKKRRHVFLSCLFVLFAAAVAAVA